VKVIYFGLAAIFLLSALYQLISREPISWYVGAFLFLTLFLYSLADGLEELSRIKKYQKEVA